MSTRQEDAAQAFTLLSQLAQNPEDSLARQYSVGVWILLSDLVNYIWQGEEPLLMKEQRLLHAMCAGNPAIHGACMRIVYRTQLGGTVLTMTNSMLLGYQRAFISSIRAAYDAVDIKGIDQFMLLSRKGIQAQIELGVRQLADSPNESAIYEIIMDAHRCRDLLWLRPCIVSMAASLSDEQQYLKEFVCMIWGDTAAPDA
jgi:hypothetical protein